MELLQFSCFTPWFSHNMRVSQPLEDPEAELAVGGGARPFVVHTAASSVEVAAVIIQPGGSGAVWVFEGHDIVKLHRGTINSTPGEDLESKVVVVKPGVP